MKRAKFTVTVDREIAKFSSLRQAMLYAEMISRDPWVGLVEVSDKDSLRGQYSGGQPTPEFKNHHINGIFR
jgi:hypothetical protein